MYPMICLFSHCKCCLLQNVLLSLREREWTDMTILKNPITLIIRMLDGKYTFKKDSSINK